VAKRERQPPSIPAAAQTLIGRELDGRYRVDAQLGVGGMGAVYRATHLKLGRPVAIKVLLEQFGQQASFLVRFEREAKALASLGHPHIVSITDYGICDGMPFLVMELLEGETLAARIKRAPFPPGQVLELAAQILRALSFVHERGLVHRDLKPGNVFLQRLPGGGEQLKLLDFGLAKYAQGDGAWVEQSLTNAGEIVGTPSYISPEQIACEPTDARTDVYSMGVLLFEMLSGRLPFEGRPADQLKMHLAAPVPPLAHLLPNHRVSPELELLLQRAMAKQREQRFQDAAEMLTALEHLPQPWLWASDEPHSGISPAGTMMSPVPVEIAGRRSRFAGSASRAVRKPVAWAAAGLAVCAAAALLITQQGWLRSQDGRAQRRHEPDNGQQQPPRGHEAAPALAAQPSTLSVGSAQPNSLAEQATAAAENAAMVTSAGSPATGSVAGATGEEAAALMVFENPEPPSGDEAAVIHDERPKPAPQPAPAPTPTPRVEPKRVAARNPWTRGTPRELRSIRSGVMSGAVGTDRTILALRAYNRANADDARGRLLLAKLYLNRNWRADAFSQYLIAYRLDPSARGATGMLTDLIDLAARGPVTGDAARLIRDGYGHEAAAPLDRAIAARKNEPGSVARLRALRARIH
jgi:serine/threonine-protein kinase